MMNSSTVATDWRRRFPFLKKYTPITLFMKTELLMMGLRISSWYGDEYRIYMWWVPLWKERAVKKTIPIVHEEMHDEKHRQVFIKYQFHCNNFERAAQCAQSAFGKFLQDRVMLSDILGYPRSELTWTTLIDVTNYYELRMAVALYYNIPKLIETTKADIEKASRKWRDSTMRLITGFTVEEWKADLYKRFEDREAFMAEIKKNSELPKVARLNTATIVNDLTPDSPCLRSYSGHLGPHRRYWPWYERLWDWLKNSLLGRK